MGGWRCRRQTGVLTPSTLEAQCPPASTRSSSDSMSWLMTSSHPAVGLVARPRSPTLNCSVWLSRRCCWTAPATGGFWPSRATASGTCFPTFPSSPPTTSASAPWPPDRAPAQPHRVRVALVLRRVVAGGRHPGPLRAVARDRPALGAGRLCRLRMEPLALPSFLGISPRAGLRARRDAWGLRTGPSQRQRAQGRRGDPRTPARGRTHHPGRQGLRGPRLRSHGRADGRTTHPARPQGRTTTPRPAGRGPPVDRIDHRHPQGQLSSSATAHAPCPASWPASPPASSLWPPPSATTNSPAAGTAASSPTTTDSIDMESIIQLGGALFMSYGSAYGAECLCQRRSSDRDGARRGVAQRLPRSAGRRTARPAFDR